MAVVRYRDENGNIVPLRVIKGENGDQMFVRFSAHADGTDMSEIWDDLRDYMGIAFGVNAPTDKADYQWVRVSHFPNSMRVDEDDNLHVKGEEITFGEAEHKVATIEKGSYVGTGNIQIDLSITLSFVPNLLVILGSNRVSILCPAESIGVSFYKNSSATASIVPVTASVTDTTITIRVTSENGVAINGSGSTYHYVALG